jgi:hypothetical protein
MFSSWAFYINEILQPESNYQLEFGVARIEGGVTIVKSKRCLSLPPRAIRLHNHKIKPPVA